MAGGGQHHIGCAGGLAPPQAQQVGCRLAPQVADAALVACVDVLSADHGAQRRHEVFAEPRRRKLDALDSRHPGPGGRNAEAIGQQLQHAVRQRDGFARIAPARP